MKKNKESLTELSDVIKHYQNSHTGVPEGEKKQKAERKSS